MQNYSVLSNKAIKRYLDNGEIIIYPYNSNNLNTSSYDVTLGPYYFREQDIREEWISNTYNIYSEDHVKRIWGKPLEAKPYSYYKKNGIYLENISDDDKIIFINPGERILGHTNEFIGGRTTVTTMMKARSSAGRNFLSVCLCSGFGDIGYYNRWTMEITNSSTKYKIPLVVGRRYAQIVFLDTEGVFEEAVKSNNFNNSFDNNSDNNSNDNIDSNFGNINYKKIYNIDGKYQSTSNIEDLIKNWSPYDMLPKMYKDREISN